MSTREQMIEQMARAMFNSGCRAPLVGTPWRDNYTAEYWRKKAEIALGAIADVPREEVPVWPCPCGSINTDGAHAYCPACGASRVGPIQATEEELTEFLNDAG